MTLNNDELVDEIRKLLKKDKKTRELLLDISHPTKKMQEYDYLWEAFHHSKYDEFTREFKFSMLVRAIDKPNTEKFYMYERLWALLIKYRESYDDYFEITLPS